MSSTLKRRLLEVCMSHAEQRIANIRSQLKLIEESRNNETKSSAGDKYETGRAMMQMEEEKAYAQLQEANAVVQVLHSIDPEKNCASVELGCLVVADSGKYFISAGIGKVRIGPETYYCISLDSPVGQLLRGLKPGDHVIFREKVLTLEDIY